MTTQLSELGCTCGVCFAPPGVECNAAPGWCGAARTEPHSRVALVNACVLCRGTGLFRPGFDRCPRCLGARTEPPLNREIAIISSLKGDRLGNYLEWGPFTIGGERMQSVALQPDRVWLVRRMVLEPLPEGMVVMGMACNHVEMLVNGSGCPAEFFSEVSTAPDLEFPVLTPADRFSLNFAVPGSHDPQTFFVRLYGFGPRVRCEHCAGAHEGAACPITYPGGN